MTQRIAYLNSEYPRVTDTFVQREIAALRRRGITIENFSVRRPGREHHVGREQRVEAHATCYLLPVGPLALLSAHLIQLVRAPRRYLAALALAFSTRPPGLKPLLYQLFYFAEAAPLARHMRQRNLTHLHNHFAKSSCSLAMIAATMGGFDFSFTIHGSQIFFEAPYWRIDEKIARARFVACISYFCRSQAMIFAHPAHWSKLKVVHCAIDPQQFTPVQRPAASKRLLFVGRLVAVKGLPLVLDVIAQLKPDHPDIQLSLVGDGPDRAALEHQVATLGLQNHVRFLGYQSQAAVREHLGNADIFVLPSFAEGVPVVLMEAMAAGVPILATRVTGIPELIDDQSTGFLVPPANAHALLTRLDTLLRDPDLRRRFARAARRKVVAEFQLDDEAALLASLFAGGPDAFLHPRPDEIPRSTAAATASPIAIRPLPNPSAA